MILRKILYSIRHPKRVIEKGSGIFRHMIHKSIDASATIRKPLLFTSRYVTLGKDVFIYNGARIQGVSQYAGIKYHPSIIIGKGTTIQQNCHITCANIVKIGEYCAITHNVTITDIDHSYEYSPFNYPPLLTTSL